MKRKIKIIYLHVLKSIYGYNSIIIFDLKLIVEEESVVKYVYIVIDYYLCEA